MEKQKQEVTPMSRLQRLFILILLEIIVKTERAHGFDRSISSQYVGYAQQANSKATDKASGQSYKTKSVCTVCGPQLPFYKMARAIGRSIFGTSYPFG